MPVVSLFAGNAPALIDDELGLAEAREFFARRSDEHRVHEERVIGPRANDADLDAIFRIPAREAVEAIEPLARVEVVERALAVDFERCARRTGYSPTPTRCRLFDAGFSTTRLSFGERPVFDAGVGAPERRSRRCSHPSQTNRVLIEHAGRKIVPDFTNGEAVGGQAE
mgnify:CR=1 FL=1